MPQNRQRSSSTDTLTRTERAKHLFFLVWIVIGVVLLVGAVGFVLKQVASVLAIIGFAALIVFLLRVPVAWLARHRVPRWAGSLISYLGALLVVVLVLLLFVPLITEQVIGLIQLLPDYIAKASGAFNDFYRQYSYLLEDSNIQQVVGSAASTLSSWAANMVSGSAQGMIDLGTGVLTSVVVLTMALIVGFWVLKDLPTIGRELRVIIGPKHEESVSLVVTVISRSFGGYLRGITVAGACTGTVAGIGYALIGLPYPAVLGLLTGLMNFIPYLGPWISGIVVALIGLFVSPLVALLAILVTLLAQQLTDNFVTPRVMSSVVELHPAIVLVGVFAGGLLGGIPGLIIAIPLLASLKAIFVYYFEKRTGRRLVDEAGALFKGRSKHDAQDEGVLDAVADATGTDAAVEADAVEAGAAVEATDNDATVEADAVEAGAAVEADAVKVAAKGAVAADAVEEDVVTAENAVEEDAVEEDARVTTGPEKVEHDEK